MDDLWYLKTKGEEPNVEEGQIQDDSTATATRMTYVFKNSVTRTCEATNISCSEPSALSLFITCGGAAITIGIVTRNLYFVRILHT
jgi:hypothetical protein